MFATELTQPLQTTQDLLNTSSTDTYLTILGRVDYQLAVAAMHNYTTQRTESSPDQIWLLEHPPTYTSGSRASPTDILHPLPYPLYQCNRGGRITFHNPGQLIIYCLIDIKRHADLRIKPLLTLLENIIIACAYTYQIHAYAKREARGIYTDQGKLASLGLSIKNNATQHGCALNVHNDLEPFKHIRACGQDIPTVHMHQYAPQSSTAILQTLQEKLQKHWPTVLIQPRTTHDQN